MTQTLSSPLPVFHDRDCDRFPIPLWLVVGVLILFPTATQAQVSSVEAHIEAFARCPVVPFPTPEPGDIRLLEAFEPWSPPRPVPPEAELRAPSTWLVPESEIERHRALRARAGVTMPSGEQQVLIFDAHAHNVLRETSLVASRDGEGRWHVDELVELWVGTPRAEMRHQRWTLSRADSLVLDGWLADPCVDAEPPRSTHTDISWSGTNVWRLETTGRQRKLLLERHFMGFGRALRIRSLIERGRPQ